MKSFKESIKQNRYSDNKLLRISAVFLIKARGCLVSVKRYLADPEYRSVQITKLFHRRSLHQTTPLTYLNRYPDTFLACVRYFEKRDHIRILSFGCSTGEEVLTLRHYFPHAEIVGADINKRSLKICRSKNTDGKISFIYSSEKNLKSLGAFDAIFCMAVFQRTPRYLARAGINDISKIYPFERFENQVVSLGDMVNPHELLIVHFSQYSFEDTRIASKYTVLNDHNQKEYDHPVFDKHGRLATGAAPYHSIFIKNA